MASICMHVYDTGMAGGVVDKWVKKAVMFRFFGVHNILSDA